LQRSIESRRRRTIVVVHGSTKAERRAARELVSTYYEAELAKLVEQVGLPATAPARSTPTTSTR
jgi:hypothetical protein